MKTVIGTLLTLAALCGLWILFVELTHSDSQSSSPQPAAPSAAQPAPAASSGNQPAGSAPAIPPRAAPAPAPQPAVSGPSSQAQRLRNFAARHNVEILSLKEFGGGANVTLRARDHIATGDLLDALTHSGIVRNFDQGAMNAQAGRDGARYYITEFKLYW